MNYSTNIARKNAILNKFKSKALNNICLFTLQQNSQLQLTSNAGTIISIPLLTFILDKIIISCLYFLIYIKLIITPVQTVLIFRHILLLSESICSSSSVNVCD